MKYAMVIVKSDEEWEARSEAEGEFEPLVRTQRTRWPRLLRPSVPGRPGSGSGSRCGQP